MAQDYRIDENGLLLSDATMVMFEDGCSDSFAIVLGAHEIGAEIPCPDCDTEHRISSALPIEVADNVEIIHVDEEIDTEDELG